MFMRSLILCALAIQFLLPATKAQPTQRFDIVIDEIFPDPSPSVGLPNSEFLELKNNSGHPINLKNWKITDGSSTATIATSYILGADSLVIICAQASVPLFSVFGPTIGVSAFPSLNNDGDLLLVIAADGTLSHALNYDVSWYKNDLKKEGGWSLEMIDTRNPCGGTNNWKASVSDMGGSPGKKNSVAADNPDQSSPALLRAFTSDSLTIVLVFDESLDSLSASIAARYSINNKMAIKAFPVAPLFQQVRLQLAEKMLPQQVYPVVATGITDCAGNAIGLFHSTFVGLPETISQKELVINEILFNPLPEGVDYVEIYNNSKKVADLHKLYLANRNNGGGLVTTVPLSTSPYLFFPGEYLTFTENRKIVLKQYMAQNPTFLIELPSLPSLPDDKGQVVLLNNQGSVIDEVPYDQQWHFPLLSSKEGVALERLSFTNSSDDKNNWTSAATTAGYGTPTYRNSQYLSTQQIQGIFSITPKVFSPDNDGFDDFCQFNFQFTQNNLTGNISLFNTTGKLVRVLVNQAILPQSGYFRWDGTDDRQQPLPSGIYIALFQVYGLDGKSSTYKKMVSFVRNLK